MIDFPNCKINLGLNVIRKREDNYHDIETAFYPLPFTDVLEIVSYSGNKNELTVTGLAVDNNKDNLCLKAYHLLKKHFPELPFVKMHLHKSIPLGAGLGGGSADAAFTLKLLKQMFLENLSVSELNNYALQLGSDCPFFLHNKPCFAFGRGENIEEAAVNLSSYKIILVNPGIHIDTSWAYNNLNASIPKKSINKIIAQPLETWKDELINDFEIPVFQKYPEIKKIKETLYENGALYASLTGSGSTVYGIFTSTNIIKAEFPKTYFSHIINLE